MSEAARPFSDVGVTVILPIFNPGSDLDVSLASALRQTHPALEILIIDDGSTKAWKHPALDDDRIRVLCQPRNLGVARARNRGVREASHNLVAFLDQDDAWENTKIEQQVQMMETTASASLCSTGFVWHFPGGRTSVAVGKPESYEDMLDSGMIHFSSVMTRRNLYLDVGGCDPSLLWAQDHDVMLKLLRCGGHVAIPVALTHYYLHERNRSKNYRGSVAFRRSVLSKHRLRAEYNGDIDSMRAAGRGNARAWELYSAQAFDAARRSRKMGNVRQTATELFRWAAGRAQASAARRGSRR